MPAIDRVTGLVGYSGMKVPVAVCATSNITLSGEQTIDGVTTSASRVLLTGQTDQTENGIWVSDSGDWSRSQDCDGPYDLRQGSVVFAYGGTSNSGFWYCTTANDVDIGTDNITWSRSSTSLAVVSAFAQTLLDDTTSNAFLTTLTATRAETGAVAVTVLSKLREVISVKDFGATGDGTTDDTTTLQAAIDAMPAAGGSLYFPSGTYKVSGALTADNPGLYFGCGYGTVIKTAHASNDVIDVSAGFVTLSDFSIQTSVTRSGGNYIDLTSTADRFLARNIHMDSPFQGVRVQSGAATVTLDGLLILTAVASTGIGVRVDGGTDITVRNLTMDTGGTEPFAGVYVTNCDDLTLEDCQLINAGQALYVNPGAGQTVVSVFANNCFFDNSTRGAYFYADGGTIARCIFDECWFSSNSANGVLLDTNAGGTINGVDFDSCHVFLNGTNGITIADSGVSNISIDGGAYAQNTGDGVNVATSVSGLRIIGARIGDSHGLTGNTSVGIRMAANVTNVVIMGNDLRGNTSAAMVDGSVAPKRVKDNLGWVTEASGTATINSGATSVTFNHGLSVTPSNKDIRVTMLENATNDPGVLYIGTISATQITVHCRADPGASNLDIGWRVESDGA